MKIQFLIVLLFIGAKSIYSQDMIDDFIDLRDSKNTCIKKITEKSFSRWKTIYLYDSTFFLIRQLNYYKNQPRADYRHEYTIIDSMTVRKTKEHLNINNNKESHTVYKYYYNFRKLCKMEIYLSSDSLSVPSILADNFIYHDSLLQSYERGRFPHTKKDPPDKILYIYNDAKQMIKELICNDISPIVALHSPDFASKDTLSHSFIYNEKGQLTDCIIETSDKRGAFTGIVCWSNSTMYKAHFRYTDFDKHGNWTKSYFITERGKVFRSRRKIEYW
jgi:hypothetical protein